MITLKISDRFFNRDVINFNNVNITLKHNAIASTFQFDFKYEPSNPDHKELTCVGHYHDVQIFDDNEKLIDGFALSQNFKHTAKEVISGFSGYSRSGAFEDCQIPPGIYPLQTNGLTLLQIARKIASGFRPQIGVKFDPEVSSIVNSVFQNTKPSATETVKSYLTKLASQKDLIVSNDSDGNLYFTNSKTDAQPILVLDSTNDGPMKPVYELNMVFNGQGIHSHVTAMRQASLKTNNSGKSTIRNPLVIGSVYRPKVLTQSSGTDNDTYSAARRALGNELRNMKITLKLSTWRLNGRIIKPNNIIQLKDPNIYLWFDTKLFIEQVQLTGNESNQQSVLTCVLPEAYNRNRTIVNPFREINIHPREESFDDVELD